MTIHHTDDAPPAIGPYCQSISADGWLYTSGVIPLDSQSGEVVSGGFEAQAKQVLANLKAVLASAGCTYQDIIKTTVFVLSMGDFPVLNQLYSEAMGSHRPARSTIQVSALPKGSLVEIEAVARIPGQ